MRFRRITEQQCHIKTPNKTLNMRFRRITEQQCHIKPTNKTLHIDIETRFRTTDYVNTR